MTNNYHTHRIFINRQKLSLLLGEAVEELLDQYCKAPRTLLLRSDLTLLKFVRP